MSESRSAWQSRLDGKSARSPSTFASAGTFFWGVEAAVSHHQGLREETEGWLVSACEPASVRVSS